MHEYRTDIKNPILVVFRPQDQGEDKAGVEVHFCPPEGYGYQHFGLILCDIGRSIARVFDIPETKMLDFIQKEWQREERTEIHRVV